MVTKSLDKGPQTVSKNNDDNSTASTHVFPYLSVNIVQAQLKTVVKSLSKVVIVIESNKNKVIPAASTRVIDAFKIAIQK